MKKREVKKKRGFWYWVLCIMIIFVVVNIITNYQIDYKKENCELTFTTYTYNDGCASACSSKCSIEGFPSTSSSYFYPYLSAVKMSDYNLYKKCECNCGGCRER